MISIVFPTYNEARSIQEVLRRASAALRKAEEDHELIVVDDASPDRTADLAEALANEIPVRVLRRPGRQGLATAVVDGWSIARGDVLGVMDADLQHPPDVLTRLVSALRNQSVDVAIATRSGPGGGSAADWRWMRRLTSWTARHLAACVLPRTLADLSDPMSGMFLVCARALQGVRLEPTGYKILLEVLGKAHYRELVEVPFVFQARTLGSSKLGMRESTQYLAHLARLAHTTGQLRSWIRYAAVGFTGAVVNVGVLVFLAERRAWPVGWALAVSILLALVNNFFWNWLFTFRTSQAPSAEPGAGIFSRLLHYGKVCATGMALNASLTLLLNWWGVPLPLASAAGVTLGGAWNLFFNVPAIWRSWDSPTPHSHGPVWDESGNRRLVSTRHTSSSRQKGVLGGIRDGSARHDSKLL
jgi:dolichol-phosphate mannosyltransferase